MSIDLVRCSFTLWYPRHMLLTRMSIFIGGASFAGAFSGLLAYGISFMSGTAGLLGWSWIFVRTIRPSSMRTTLLTSHSRLLKA